MELNIKGIKCDNRMCDYEELEGNWGNTSEEITETSNNYLNKPCPKCGEPLLTQEDYDAVINLLETIPIYTKLENLLYGDSVPDDQKSTFDVCMNGTGEFKFLTQD